MDDFDLSGPASSGGPPAAPPLSEISIAYALLTYFAFAFLAIGLLIQTIRLLRMVMRQPPELGSGSLLGRLFRAGTDVLLLRTTFFADRWAWIFGAAFHFGLVLILLRHLRYFIDPNWVGPLWKLVELVQPFGFYGGLALPFGALCWWGRQVFLKQGRLITDWADHAVMALLIAIPVLGYINTTIHTDVVQVKAFAIGLLTFKWVNLPADPVLLAHLWLFAALMIVVPFSRLLLLLPFGNLLQLKSSPDRSLDRGRRKVIRAIAPALIVILLIPAAVVARHGLKQGFQPSKTDFSALVSGHKSEEGTVMIRNHPSFLFSHRTTVLHQAKREQNNNIERCVTCHVKKDAEGQPVSFEDPNHFCRGCHTKAAVTIDCFECHTSKPIPEQQTMRLPHERFATTSTRNDERTAVR